MSDKVAYSTSNSNGDGTRRQRYYIIHHSQDECMPGNWNDEKSDMLFVFTKREDTMDTAHRAAKRQNKSYWSDYLGMKVEERPDGYLQRGEINHKLFSVKEIGVEVVRDGSIDWLWAINKTHQLGSDGFDDPFFCGSVEGKEKATKRFKEVIEERRSLRPTFELSDNYQGDLPVVVWLESTSGIVEREVCLITKINIEFEDYFDCMMDDEVRQYVQYWSPWLECRVQLVKFPIHKGNCLRII